MYHTTSKGIAALGRNGDDTLLHVKKGELAGLEALLGPVTTNPKTGLPEAFNWTDILASLGVGIAGALTGGAALAAAPEIGAIGATAAGAGTGALLGGGISAAEGKGFAPGALGGAISGGMGGYGGADLGEIASPTPAKAAMTVGMDGNPSFADALGQQGATMMTKPGMEELLKPVGLGAMLGATAQGTMEQASTGATQLRNQKLQQAKADAEQRQYFASLGFPLPSGAAGTSADPNQQRDYFGNLIYGKAAGGPIEMSRTVGGVPIHTTVPPKYVSQFENSDVQDNLDPALQNLQGISQGVQQTLSGQGFATGGYANTQPFNPQDFYPQSRIASAQPYAAAGNTGVINTLAHGASFAEGGGASTSSLNTTFEMIPTEAGKSPIVDVAGRKIAVANISGKKVPFYVSTGKGGKAGVPAGKWYPYFGHGPDGWFNKGPTEADITKFYDSPVLKQVSQHLDKTLGDMRGATHYNGVPIPNVQSGGVSTQFINEGLSPTISPRSTVGVDDFARWTKDVKANISNTVDQVHDAVRYGAQPSTSATAGASSIPEELRAAAHRIYTAPETDSIAGKALSKASAAAMPYAKSAAVLGLRGADFATQALMPDFGREAPDADVPRQYGNEGLQPNVYMQPSTYASGGITNAASYDHGGFLDGPGDGMSDDIPANIDGHEEVRLADGEFVVPPELVSLIGGGDPEEGKRLLDQLLPMVRQAAHGKKEQVKQDAGKLAAEKLLVRKGHAGRSGIAAG
jgi:hypothetical protein